MEITLEKTIADKLDLRRVTNSSKKTLRKFNLRYEIRTIEGEPQRFVIYFKMDVLIFGKGREYYEIGPDNILKQDICDEW